MVANSTLKNSKIGHYSNESCSGAESFLQCRTIQKRWTDSDGDPTPYACSEKHKPFTIIILKSKLILSWTYDPVVYWHLYDPSTTTKTSFYSTFKGITMAKSPTPGRQLLSIDDLGRVFLSSGDLHASSHHRKGPSAGQETNMAAAMRGVSITEAKWLVTPGPIMKGLAFLLDGFNLDLCLRLKRASFMRIRRFFYFFLSLTF